MDITLSEVAKILNASESTVSRWVEKEGLPAFFINGRYRFNRVDILEWASRRKLPAADLSALSDKLDVPPLAELLEGNIHYGVPGTDMRSVMVAVIERLPLPNPRDKALAAQALLNRQELGSTGVGEGIAIPHARCPLVFPVPRPVLVLCFLERPADFGAHDGIPVSVVWAVISPGVRAHLSLLAKLSAALHDPQLRSLLQSRGPAPEILARLKELA